MSIPEEIYNDILINYSNVQDNYLISKYIENKRNIKMKNAIKLINKHIYKYILDMRICMDINYYHTPKIHYKKFYPLRDRKKMMVLALDMVQNDDYYYRSDLYDDILANPNHLVFNFNKFIDSLEMDELAYIGW